MERRIFLWIVVGILFVLALFLTFKTGSVEATGNAVSAGQAVAPTTAPSYGGMVGGC